jgi:hypothetical protein
MQSTGACAQGGRSQTVATGGGTAGGAVSWFSTPRVNGIAITRETLKWSRVWDRVPGSGYAVLCGKRIQICGNKRAVKRQYADACQYHFPDIAAYCLVMGLRFFFTRNSRCVLRRWKLPPPSNYGATRWRDKRPEAERTGQTGFQVSSFQVQAGNGIRRRPTRGTMGRQVRRVGDPPSRRFGATCRRSNAGCTASVPLGTGWYRLVPDKFFLSAFAPKLPPPLRSYGATSRRDEPCKKRGRKWVEPRRRKVTKIAGDGSVRERGKVRRVTPSQTQSDPIRPKQTKTDQNRPKNGCASGCSL